jgi:Fe-S-cluster containining protein
MNCRPGCAACCTAPSISTPIPQPDGSPAAPKAAGVPCVQLDSQLRCRLFGHPTRPAVCSSLRPDADMCGDTREHAMVFLTRLERLTG